MGRFLLFINNSRCFTSKTRWHEALPDAMENSRLSPACTPVKFASNRLVVYHSALAGEVDERFKSHAWKACVG